MSINREITEKDEKNMYESLHKNGIMDNIKTYLRSSLAQTILNEKNLNACNVDFSKTGNFNFNGDIKINTNINNNLIRKTINNGDFDRIKLYKIICSLIKDFMKKANLTYSFSVFGAESGFTDLLTEEEISKCLNITYSNLDNAKEENFLAYITKNLLNAREKNSISVQASKDDFTSEFENNSSQASKFRGLSTAKSIEKKFKEIDEKYYKLTFLETNSALDGNKNNIFQNLMPAKALEEKMLKYQRECEAKYKIELDREILRIKEIELSNIRIEENKKYLKKIEDIRDEYEEEYNSRYENLKKRESEFNIRMANKEKEFEVLNFETRQKYLTQIEALKLKQEELRIKYENDLNLLALKEEKISFKEKDLENLRQNAIKKINEEIESFKIEYQTNFESEKAEIHKQKLKSEEIQFKSKLVQEQFIKYESENKSLNEELKRIKYDIKKIDDLNKDYKEEINLLRDQLKILSANEKRNYDEACVKVTENESLRTENKILKDNIHNLQSMNNDRKNDQGVIIEDLKIQIKENTRQFNRVKEDLENENGKLRKQINELLEKIKENATKGPENKRKTAESNKQELLHTNNVLYQKQLLNAQQELRKQGINHDYSLDYLNIGNNNKISNNFNYNNYLTGGNNRLERKNNDNIFKLEKEAEEIKQEIKNNFVNKTNLNNDENNSNKDVSPIFNEFNLWNLKNKSANSQITHLENSIVNALFEKLKCSNLFGNHNNTNLNHSHSNAYVENTTNANLKHTNINPKMNNNSFESSQKINNPKKSNNQLNTEANSNNNDQNNNKRHDKNFEYDEFINVDKLHETPMFNTNNQNIYNNISKEPFNNDVNKNNFNNENNNNSNNKSSGNKNISTNNIIPSDFNYENKNNKINNYNNESNPNSDRNREIVKLQNALEKIKQDHNENMRNKNNIKENNQSNIQSNRNNNINIIDNYQTNQINNPNKSNRDSNSSIECELSSNKNEKNLQNMKNNKPSINNVGNNSLANSQKQTGHKSVKIKDLKDKAIVNSIYGSMNFENSKKINSIKEESDEHEKENISSFDDNNNKNNNIVTHKSQKEDTLTKANKTNDLSNNYNTDNIQKKINNLKTNISNISAINGNNHKNHMSNISNINNLTNKSNSYQDFENTENLEALNLKNSFNKFSNVNFDYDQKSIEEDIKSENPSDNYGDDFIEDVDNIDNKNHRISFDLDAIKNVSNNFIANNSYIKDASKNTNSRSKDRSTNTNNMNQNNYKNIKNGSDLKGNKINNNSNNVHYNSQSKNSINDDNVIEEIISMNSSSKRDKQVASNKSLTIDDDSCIKSNKENYASNEYKYNFSDNMIKSNIEDSNQNYNDLNYNLSNNISGSNTLKNIIISKEILHNKENSNVKLLDSKNSDIKEEIFDDDGYEPINYD